MSTTDDSAFHREREIFLEAIEKASKEECDAFVAEACGGDDTLRARVERLLANRENKEMAKFLAAPAETLPVTSPAAIPLGPIVEKTGSVIGHYKLLEKIYLSTVALSYYYLSNHHTLSVFFGRDLMRPRQRQRWARHIERMVLDFLAAGASGEPGTAGT